MLPVPPEISQTVPATLTIAEPYQRPAITPRGVAALRLADFRDVWAELDQADRAWFAEDLTELLVDACLEAPTA